jgi:thymidylate synthase (FAD)
LKVTLVSSSEPSKQLVEQGIVNVQELVAYCARVSNPANQTNTDTSEKLIRYLIKHKHWSPLEMVSACLEIETTRDIARQILRHRSFSFQEFSQRYAVADLGFEYKEARLQDTKNRQNSIELGGATLGEQNLIEQWRHKQAVLAADASEVYKWALNNGIAKEQARAVLPEGITTSRLYMQGTLRSWLHYIELRSGPETQKEHREIARACAGAMEPIFPMISSIIRYD